MNLNTANRAFAALLVASACAYGVLGLAAVGLVSLFGYQAFSGDDILDLVGPHDFRPALVFLCLIIAGNVLAWRSLRRQVRATRGLGRRVRSMRIHTPPEVVIAAQRTRLRRRVDVVDSDDPFSFAYGLFFPRVVVSRGLAEVVSERELEAVLEHERYHVVNLDPLKVVLARVLPWALFFLPVLRDLRRRYVAGRELAADRRAVETCGKPALAGALYKVVQGPPWSELGAAAAIGGTELLEARVSQLETGREPDVPGVSKLAALASTAGIAVLVWSFAASLGDIGGPVGRVFGGLVPGLTLRAGHIAWDLTHIAIWILLGRFVYGRFCRRARRA